MDGAGLDAEPAGSVVAVGGVSAVTGVDGSTTVGAGTIGFDEIGGAVSLTPVPPLGLLEERSAGEVRSMPYSPTATTNAAADP